MAQIFRVEGTKNFTVIVITISRIRILTLKAKAYCLMLSLQRLELQYAGTGNTELRDGIDSVRSAIKN